MGGGGGMLKKTMEERGDQKKIQVIIRCNQTGLSRPPGGYTLCTCGLGAYTLVKKKKKKKKHAKKLAHTRQRKRPTKNKNRTPKTEERS